MPIPDELARISWLYHFTDARNLPSIKSLGGLFSRAKLVEMGVQNLFPGGNQWSLDADEMFGMDRYVHLCLRSTHPMEYVARQDGRIQRSVFLYVDREVLGFDGVLFTPDVANKSGVQPCPIAEAAAYIDFDVLCTRTDWSDPAVQERLQAAEKCEILIPDHIPFKYFEKYFPNGLLPNG